MKQSTRTLLLPVLAAATVIGGFTAHAADISWNVGSGTWDAITPNWTGDSTTFTDGGLDHVLFNNPAGGTVTVAGMTPASTTVDSSGNYILSTGTPGVSSVLGGTLTKSGSGVLTLGNAAWTTTQAATYSNSFSSVQVNGGTLVYASRLALGGGTITLGGGTTLMKTAQEGNTAALGLPNNLVLNGQLNMRVVFAGNKDQYFTGQISGDGSIKVTGERRTLALTGNNSFTGGVTMEAAEGTLYNFDIGHVNALGTGTLTVKTVGTTTGTPYRGLGTTTALTTGSGVTNDIVIETGATLTVGRGFNLRLGGDISGDGSLYKRNTTTVILDGTNTHSGVTTVEAGILSLGNSLALQNSALNTTGSTAGSGTAGLQTTVTTLTLGGLTGNKNFAASGGVFSTTSGGYGGVTALTLNPGPGATHSYSGGIADGAVGMTLTKTGAGTQILAGTNTYTGETHVSDGVLAVDGQLASTTTTIGTSAVLRGSGSIGGSVTVQTGGTIAAGNSIESLATGALTLAAGSTFAYEFDPGALPGVAGDLTAVTGNLTLDLSNLAKLSLSEISVDPWNLGDKLTLISYTGSWNGGLFDYGGTLADDSTVTINGTAWRFNYNDTVAGSNYVGDLTGSSFVTMTVIPEPSTALLGGLGLLTLLRRRRA